MEQHSAPSRVCACTQHHQAVSVIMQWVPAVLLSALSCDSDEYHLQLQNLEAARGSCTARPAGAVPAHQVVR